MIGPLAATNSFVLGASMALAWFFDDETTAATEAVFDLVTNGVEALAPPLWPYEVANSLAVAERRKRTTPGKTAGFLNRLAKFPITIGWSDANTVAHVFEQVLSLARQHKLSTYDAAYLELALREGLPLATLDRNLRKAAEAAGVDLVNPSPKQRGG